MISSANKELFKIYSREVTSDANKEEVHLFQSAPSNERNVEAYVTRRKSTASAVRKGHKTQPSSCDICGDAAGYHHYDVASCNGCRTFFRRTLVNQKVYKCVGYARNCYGERLKDCRACRFDRCLLVGMKLEAVQLPAHLKIRRLSNALASRREELLQAKHTQDLKLTPLSADTQHYKDLDMLVYVEARCAALRESTDPMPLYTQGLRSSVECPVRLSNMDPYQVEMGFRAPPVFLHTGQALPLRTVGWSRVWIGIDLVFCVEMAKTLPVFRWLTADDKELVLKHVAAASVMLTRLFFSASRNYPLMKMPDGTSVISPIIRTGLESDVYVRSLEPFQREKLTLEEYVLLKAIIYTCADVNRLSKHAREILCNARERYAGLLLSHLQRTLGKVDGAVRYASVLPLADACFHFGRKFREHWIASSMQFAVPPPFHLVQDVFGATATDEYFSLFLLHERNLPGF